MGAATVYLTRQLLTVYIMMLLYCCFSVTKKSDTCFADQLIKDHKHSRQNKQNNDHTNNGSTCKQCADRPDHLNLRITGYFNCQTDLAHDP